jgi:hypothetical protein
MNAKTSVVAVNSGGAAITMTMAKASTITSELAAQADAGGGASYWTRKDWRLSPRAGFRR